MATSSDRRDDREPAAKAADGALLLLDVTLGRLERAPIADDGPCVASLDCAGGRAVPQRESIVGTRAAALRSVSAAARQSVRVSSRP